MSSSFKMQIVQGTFHPADMEETNLCSFLEKMRVGKEEGIH